MTITLRLVVLRFIPSCLAIAVGWPATTAIRAQQQPVFRSTAVGVSVDVSVKKGNTPVANLTAADFALSDNGVPQVVESVQIETVPVDVTLAVDVSGSTRGLLGRYRSDVAAIAQLLRPVDRLRLIAFGSEVDEPLRLGSIAGRAPVERLAASSYSAVYDGIAAALLRPTGIDRRHLIVAFTDSYDNRSVVSPELLAAAASRSESVLHIVSREPPSMGASEMLVNGLFWPPVALDAVAEATGGLRHTPAAWITEPGGSLVFDFSRIFDDFRQSYVLRFRPTGVPLQGWHELTVGLRLKGNYKIRARRGYFGG
jgi:hypothetical protein